MTTYVSHRINTIAELQATPTNIGVEVDLRDYNENIYMQHDPYVKPTAERFDEFLKSYRHRFIILNIKSERIEWKVLELLKMYEIEDYFFLDSSFPMIYNLSMKHGNSKIAMRYSEFESFDSVLNMSNHINWVWVDCFTKFPLTHSQYIKLCDRGIKICVVSPELQGQEIKLTEYKKYMKDNQIVPDMICTKHYNISTWIK